MAAVAARLLDNRGTIALKRLIKAAAPIHHDASLVVASLDPRCEGKKGTRSPIQPAGIICTASLDRVVAGDRTEPAAAKGNY